jgi:hypothetical protein
MRRLFLLYIKIGWKYKGTGSGFKGFLLVKRFLIPLHTVKKLKEERKEDSEGWDYTCLKIIMRLSMVFQGKGSKRVGTAIPYHAIHHFNTTDPTREESKQAALSIMII